MKRIVLLFGSLLLVLLVSQAVANPPADEVTVTPNVEEDASSAPEPAPAEESACVELFSETLPLSDPQPAATCSPIECRQQCKQGCSGGCFCGGSCATGECVCTETCF